MDKCKQCMRKRFCENIITLCDIKNNKYDEYQRYPKQPKIRYRITCKIYNKNNRDKFKTRVFQFKTLDNKNRFLSEIKEYDNFEVINERKVIS